MKAIYLFILGLFSFSFSSCVEEVTLQLDKQDYEKIVVEGMITNETRHHLVKISKTIDYSQKGQLPALQEAQVTISDGDSVVTLNETKPGIYETPLMAGVIGKTYNLTIVKDKKTYKAQSTMAPAFQVDSLNFKLTQAMGPRDPSSLVLMSGQESPEQNQCYLIKMIKNGQLQDTLNKWGILSDYMFNGKYIKDEPCLFADLKENDSVTLEVYSIDEKFFFFISQCQQTTQPAMFFNPPPANVKGNVSDDVLGYFSASAVKRSANYKYNASGSF